MMLNRRHAFAIGATCAVVAACAVPNATNRMKKELTQHGSIDAEWEIRDDAEEKTYTYVMLRTEGNVHETYVITALDGQRNVTRDHIGGIDGTGCYLLDAGVTSKWIAQLPPEALQETSKSGTKTRTACLEYKDGPGWIYIPPKDRKAAEPPPPPPPPKPSASPDMGTADGAATAEEPADDKGDVKSAIP